MQDKSIKEDFEYIIKELGYLNDRNDLERAVDIIALISDLMIRKKYNKNSTENLFELFREKQSVSVFLFDHEWPIQPFIWVSYCCRIKLDFVGGPKYLPDFAAIAYSVEKCSSNSDFEFLKKQIKSFKDEHSETRVYSLFLDWLSKTNINTLENKFRKKPILRNESNEYGRKTDDLFLKLVSDISNFLNSGKRPIKFKINDHNFELQNVQGRWAAPIILELSEKLQNKSNNSTFSSLSKLLLQTIAYDDDDAPIPLYPDELKQSFQSEAFYSLAQISNHIVERAISLETAIDLGKIIDVEARQAALREAAAAFGWTEEFNAGLNEGLFFLAKAGDLGDSKSLRILAEITLKGYFPERSAKDAIGYFNAAGEAGDYQAFKRLGEIYENGIFIDRDDSISHKYFKRYVRDLEKLIRNNEIDQREGYLALGWSAYNDEGYSAERPEISWAKAKIYWLKSLGIENFRSNDLTNIVLTRDNKIDKVAASSLERLAHLSWYGLSTRQSTSTSYRFLRKAAHLSINARDRLFSLRLVRHPNKSEILRKLYINKYGKNAATADPTANRLFLESQTFDDRQKRQSVISDKSDLSRFTLALSEYLFNDSAVATIFPADDLSYLGNVATLSPRTRALIIDSKRLISARDVSKKIILKDVAAIRNFTSDRADILSFVKKIFEKKTNLISTEILDFVTLRNELAKLCNDANASSWRRALQWLQIHSDELSCLIGLSKTARKKSGANIQAQKIVSETVKIGLDHNPRDSNGFPIFGDNNSVKINKPKSVDLGYDSIQSLLISGNELSVLKGQPTARDMMPIITYEDLLVVATLALIEPTVHGKTVEAPSFSLEQLNQIYESRHDWKILQKVFENPEWLSETEFGHSLYYADKLLFISDDSNEIFSIKNPLEQPPKRFLHAPELLPWRRSYNGGGVRASPSSRNAYVVDAQNGNLNETTSRHRNDGYKVVIPQVLSHFDGSEFTFKLNGENRDRDGGRNMLRYWAVRHAAIMSGSMPEIMNTFPVFRRVALLFAIYSTLRSSFAANNNWLAGSALYNKLQSTRNKYRAHYDERSKDPLYNLVLW